MTDRASRLATLERFLREDTTARVDGLTERTDLWDGLGLDSVDFVGTVMRLEGHYRIRIKQSELDGLVTVGELLDLIDDKLSARSAAAA